MSDEVSHALSRAAVKEAFVNGDDFAAATEATHVFLKGPFVQDQFSKRRLSFLH